MDPLAILTAVNNAITLANAAIQAGKDAAPFIEAIYNNVTGNGDNVTQVDLDALAVETEALHEELQKPLGDEGL